MNIAPALKKFRKLVGSGHVLDVGSGKGEHARWLRQEGCQVTTLDPHPNSPADISVPLEDWQPLPSDRFDGVLCSHCLEHSLNPHTFLRLIQAVLKSTGWLCLVVPPPRHRLVSGHINTWNEAQLIYRLVLAGFDCSKAQVGVWGYNIAVVVQAKRFVLPQLTMNEGDIERLAKYFPWPVEQGIDGRRGSINW